MDNDPQIAPRPVASLRLDANDAEWPSRPWVMALICAVGGLLFNWLIDFDTGVDPSPLRTAVAIGMIVGTVIFALTVEPRRWHWSLLFALGWGLVIGLVGWSLRNYSIAGSIFEWPFFSSVFAVLIAAPLFQTARDEGAWRFPHMRAHTHAWGDAVIGAAALLFVGISFLLTVLIAGLFNIIGITLVKRLLDQSWFGWMLAGFAFGAAVGLLRERDALVAMLQRLVMVVLAVLAPVLALALTAFLISLPITGLAGLWNGWLSATALTLAAAGGAFLLINAAIGHGDEDRPIHPILRWSALVLALAVLPLAALAFAALTQRVNQYGWTPERIWGVIAASVALGYGAIGWWSVIRGRRGFDAVLRPLQVTAALGICAIALILSLPIIDFGAISARDQVARLTAGRVTNERFDWEAMAFDFGPAGRQLLQRLGRSPDADRRRYATAALAAESRHGINQAAEIDESASRIDANLQTTPANLTLPDGLRTAMIDARLCAAGPCRLQRMGDTRWLLVGRRTAESDPQAILFDRDAAGRWEEVALTYVPIPGNRSTEVPADLATARIEIRDVIRQRVVVDGVPIGEIVE